MMDDRCAMWREDRIQKPEAGRQNPGDERQRRLEEKRSEGRRWHTEDGKGEKRQEIEKSGDQKN